MEYKAELLVDEVVTVGPDDSVQSVTDLLRQKKIGCVMVEKDGKLVGIFTERDLVMKVLPAQVDLANTPVKKYMTPDPEAVDKDEPLGRVFDLLSLRRFRHVPITDKGKPVGIISLSDFAAVLKEVFEDERYVNYFVDAHTDRLKDAL